MSACAIELHHNHAYIMTTGILADHQLAHYDNNTLLVDLYQSL